MITQYYDGIKLKFASESQLNMFLELDHMTQETLVKEYNKRTNK